LKIASKLTNFIENIYVYINELNLMYIK